MEQPKPAKSRIRRTQQQIQDLLNEFSKSDCTVREFCRINEIGQATFHKWQSRLKSNAAKKSISPGFANVLIDSTSQGALFAEVKGIRVYQPVSAAYLKELIS
jgi:hypothetical protein